MLYAPSTSEQCLLFLLSPEARSSVMETVMFKVGEDKEKKKDCNPIMGSFFLSSSRCSLYIICKQDSRCRCHHWEETVHVGGQWGAGRQTVSTEDSVSFLTSFKTDPYICTPSQTLTNLSNPSNTSKLINHTRPTGNFNG